MSEALTQRTPDKVLEATFEQSHGEPVTPRRGYDRRQHERRFLNTNVRFMVVNGFEDQGALCDISRAGFKIRGGRLPAIGDTIIAYMDEIGRFQGLVIRHEEDDAFAAQMNLSASKLARLEHSLDAYFAKEETKGGLSDRRSACKDRRRHERRRIDLDYIEAARSTGEAFRCSVANISFCGVEIMTDQSLTIGETVTIGVVQGVVTRKTDIGYAVARV